MAWKADVNHDGRLMAVSYGHWRETGQVVVFDTNTSQERYRFTEPRGVRALAVTPDRKQFVSGSVAGHYRVVGFETGTMIRQWQQDDGSVEGMCFSPDGKYLIAGSHTKNINIHDFDSGTRIKQLKIHNDMVYAVAVSPDGKWLASSDRSGQIVVSAFPSGEVRHQFAHVDDSESKRVPANCGLLWSKDSRQVFSAGFNDTIRVFDVESGESLNQSKPFGSMDALLATPDGRLLFTCDASGLHRFDAKTLKESPFPPLDFKESEIKPHARSVPGLRWFAKHKIISASWDKSVRVWDSNTGRCLQVFKPKPSETEIEAPSLARRSISDQGIRFVTFSADGTEVWAFTMDGRCHVLDSTTLETQGEPVKLIDSIANGAVVQDRSNVLFTTFSKRLLLVDTATWRTNQFVKTGDVMSRFWSVAVSSNGRLAAVGKDQSILTLIDVASNTPKWSTVLGDLPVSSISFSPDLKHMLATTGDYRKWQTQGAVYLLNVATGMTLKKLQDHSTKVNLSGFLADGRYLFTAGSDRQILTYDTHSAGKKPVQLRTPGGVDQVQLLNDGIAAISYYGGGVAICDLLKGKIVGRTTGHSNKKSMIHGMSLSPDEKQVVTVNLAGEVCLWSVEKFTAK